MKKINLALLFFILFAPFAFAQADQLTLTTYYPAPFGMYQEMRVMGKLGVGTTDPVAGLDVNGSIIFTGGSGDVNKDGAVNATDGLIIGQYVNGLVGLSREAQAIADVDGDGLVTMEDANIILMMFTGVSREEAKRRVHNIAYQQISGAGAGVENCFLINGKLGVGTTVNPTVKLEVKDGDALIYDMTVGRGAGNQIANTAVGNAALAANTTAIGNTALGYRALQSTTEGLANTAQGFSALRLNTLGNDNLANGYQALYANTAGSQNTAIGSSALRANTTGNGNTATGYRALYTSSTGLNNTAVGYAALYSNTTHSNTALGAQALYANTTGGSNTATGSEALQQNTTGHSNTASGRMALYFNTTGSGNTAVGLNALYANTTADYNTALGYSSMAANTTGTPNVAVGIAALFANTAGGSNTAIGPLALYLNTTGNENSALGNDALRNNTTGLGHTAVGHQALRSNSAGMFNTAIGYQALFSNTSTVRNTAVGYQSLYANTTGNRNTGVGQLTLKANTTGLNNTAAGGEALSNNTTGGYNTASGYHALLYNITGSNNTAVGHISGPASGLTNLENTTAIGSGAQVTASNTVRIGDSSVTQISGQVAWSFPSDGRFKKDVQENVPGLEFIARLRPVTFYWDMKKLKAFEGQPYDDGAQTKEKILYTGFIAQEVEAVAQELGYDFSGVNKPQNDRGEYTLGYSAFTVPLVKAVQELQAQNKVLEARIETLASEVERLRKN